MCGRYTITVDEKQIRARFECSPGELGFGPRWNVAPSQQVPVVVKVGAGRKLILMKWGMIPRWAKDPALGNKLINARVESVADKPAFRESFRRRRCLIPADGYYEWMKLGKNKQPMRIVLRSGELFAFAGLWDTWVNPQGDSLNTFTILTTEPAASLRLIHNRMPLILSRQDEDKWLTLGMPDTAGANSFSPADLADSLKAYPVSRLVNSPALDSPELIREIPDQFQPEISKD